MAAPPQQQLTPIDHHYFEWSKQTNHIYPNRRQYYDEKRSLEDNQLNENSTLITSNGPIRKKQKLNETESLSINSNNEQNHSQSCYPFQAELTQKIDIECANNNTLSSQTNHHFTLSTVINLSVNGQPQKLPPLSSIKSSDLSTLIPYSDFNFSLYLKDIDLSTFDMFILPTCPNPQDYLTVDGLLTFLMSDKMKYPRTQSYQQQQHSYPQYQTTNDPGLSSSYYRQSSYSQRYYSPFR